MTFCLFGFSLAYLAFPLADKIIYLIATIAASADSLTDLWTSISRLPSPTEEHQLSRFSYQFETAEASSPMDWAIMGLSTSPFLQCETATVGLLFGKLFQLKDKQEVLQPLRCETAIVTISMEANLIISYIYIYI